MSKNLSSLARRKGTKDSLFEQLVTEPANKSDSARKALAKNHLVGESTVKGAASFYDFLEGKNSAKKAYVCNGSSCLCANTQNHVQSELEKHFEKDDIGHITCLGLCNKNSSFRVDGVNYAGDDINQLNQILGKPPEHVVDPLYVESLASQAILTTPVTDIKDYYQLFIETTDKHNPEQILAQISDSGLRGRGGAGFPTGFKWTSCREALGSEKYVVCNADEGDPGAFSDRYLLEQNPHSVLFGMLMAGWLTGAGEGILYIRDEYPEAISVCEQAIKQLEQDGLLNKGDWSFKFKVIKGAGAYICGEETALLRSIEGQRPIVSVRPPFPTQSGLYGLPTALNNVETFASIHWILNNGSEAFKTLGNGRSTGTKLLSLDSCFSKPGIYEVEMGTPLNTVIEAAGGFSQSIKALHIGGPLGGLVPRSHFEKLTVDFESFAQNGFLLGHASIIGIPETMPMIKYLQHLFDFTATESCGKCFPCRIGATRGEEMMSRALHGEEKMDRELLDDLLETMKLGSLCALGGGVPLPVENALQYFDYELKPFFKTNDKIDIREIR
jgi:NADH:ubiquinone oxidoreductase subunit F (NADH-binding)